MRNEEREMRNPKYQISGFRHKRLLAALLVALGVMSCSSIDCPIQNKVRAVYSVRNADMAVDTLRDTLAVHTLRFNKTDTLVLNDVSKVVQFSLAVGYNNPEDTLFFHFRNGTYKAVDTVWLKKDNMPHFESVDCNVAFFHRLTAVRSTRHAIDSITIHNPTVTYDDSQTQHLYLYLKSRH